VRNATLHGILESFVGDAALQLSAATAGGEELPFELVESQPARRGRASLYCYRPLTATFIAERLGRLAALPSYAPAVRALAEAEGTGAYLRLRGEQRIPALARERGERALRVFLARVFEERSQFALEPARFEAAYAELEHALYAGRGLATVIAPLLGIALDSRTSELPIGEGLSLVAGRALADAPPEAVHAAGEEPNLIVVLRVAQDPTSPAPVSQARMRFRRLLTALRLYERGGYALGPLAWARVEEGPWRSLPLCSSGRPRLLTLIPAAQEDELRGFCNLVARRLPSSGEIAWALARFEMGCERIAPFEALSDYLLALRALLEPEGPASGLLAQRLAVLCAEPPRREALAARTAEAVALERAVIAGAAERQAGSAGGLEAADTLVEELGEHLRALLRDVLCGHLPPDLRVLADELLEDALAAA
jgi:hypothetical protein